MNESTDPVPTDEIEKPEKARKPHPVLWSAIMAAVFSLVFGTVSGFVAGTGGSVFLAKLYPKFFHASDRGSSQSDQSDSRERISDEDSAITDVAEKSSPAVVSIVISKDLPNTQDLFDFLYPFYNGSDSPQSKQDSGSGTTHKETIGGGSGFLISADGMIVTNKHVVADQSADYTVVTSDGKEYPAKIMAVDPSNDIAVIKIDGNDFPTLEFGDSDSLKTGQTVIAIGNSLGEFSNTVSKGIISGLKRNVTASSGVGVGDTENLTNIIQTDAAINLGNSGGPLLDVNGQVIGVNVAMAQDAQNIGFALPSKQIEKVVNQVKDTGKISSPYIGVRYLPIDSTIKSQLNDFSYDYGALLARGEKVTDFAVIPGSPADKAGLMENDVILEIDGTKIDKSNSLADLVAKHNVGDTISLKVWHKGEEKDMQITLGERK